MDTQRTLEAHARLSQHAARSKPQIGPPSRYQQRLNGQPPHRRFIRDSEPLQKATEHELERRGDAERGVRCRLEDELGAIWREEERDR